MEHPVVIIGAGPIGLAAAAHAHSRGLAAIVIEAGERAGSAVSEWGHVRLFSPWRELVDPVARELLEAAHWSAPDPTTYPTGAEWIADYLNPLADALVSNGVDVRVRQRVVGVARAGRDLTVNAGRDTEPLEVLIETPSGRTRLTAGAVIDASGTWGQANPLGADGYLADGEAEHGDHITYGIPDLADPSVRARFAGKHVAVAGSGASAQNVLISLGALATEAPGTRVSWLIRRPVATFGGGDNDQLEQRGALGDHAKAVADSATVTTFGAFRTLAVHSADSGRLALEARDGRRVEEVDEIVVVTGFRPDLSFLSEVRLDLDAILQAPRQLAPLIDPNEHSCGTVYPHGAAVLAQPEPGFYFAGMKSYGRAPSFLTLTGFEQTRSIVAAIAGDQEAADRVELVLPETGVCGGAGVFDDASATGGCCAPAPQLLSIGAPLTLG